MSSSGAAGLIAVLHARAAKFVRPGNAGVAPDLFQHFLAALLAGLSALLLELHRLAYRRQQWLEAWAEVAGAAP